MARNQKILSYIKLLEKYTGKKVILKEMEIDDEGNLVDNDELSKERVKEIVTFKFPNIKNYSIKFQVFYTIIHNTLDKDGYEMTDEIKKYLLQLYSFKRTKYVLLNLSFEYPSKYIGNYKNANIFSDKVISDLERYGVNLEIISDKMSEIERILFKYYNENKIND